MISAESRSNYLLPATTWAQLVKCNVFVAVYQFGSGDKVSVSVHSSCDAALQMSILHDHKFSSVDFPCNLIWKDYSHRFTRTSEAWLQYLRFQVYVICKTKQICYRLLQANSMTLLFLGPLWNLWWRTNKGRVTNCTAIRAHLLVCLSAHRPISCPEVTGQLCE